MSEVDWWSRVPAYAGLALSAFAVWRGRTTLKVSLGNQDNYEDFRLEYHPHEGEIVSLGTINADGSLSDWSDGPTPGEAFHAYLQVVTQRSRSMQISPLGTFVMLTTRTGVVALSASPEARYSQIQV